MTTPCSPIPQKIAGDYTARNPSISKNFLIVKTDFTHPTFKVLLLWLSLQVEVLNQDCSNGRLNYTTSTVSTSGRSAKKR